MYKNFLINGISGYEKAIHYSLNFLLEKPVRWLALRTYSNKYEPMGKVTIYIWKPDALKISFGHASMGIRYFYLEDVDDLYISFVPHEASMKKTLWRRKVDSMLITNLVKDISYIERSYDEKIELYSLNIVALEKEIMELKNNTPSYDLLGNIFSAKTENCSTIIGKLLHKAGINRLWTVDAKQSWLSTENIRILGECLLIGAYTVDCKIAIFLGFSHAVVRGKIYDFFLRPVDRHSTKYSDLINVTLYLLYQIFLNKSFFTLENAVYGSLAGSTIIYSTQLTSLFNSLLKKIAYNRGIMTPELLLDLLRKAEQHPYEKHLRNKNAYSMSEFLPPNNGQEEIIQLIYADRVQRRRKEIEQLVYAVKQEQESAWRNYADLQVMKMVETSAKFIFCGTFAVISFYGFKLGWKTFLSFLDIILKMSALINFIMASKTDSARDTDDIPSEASTFTPSYLFILFTLPLLLLCTKKFLQPQTNSSPHTPEIFPSKIIKGESKVALIKDNVNSIFKIKRQSHQHQTSLEKFLDLSEKNNTGISP